LGDVIVGSPAFKAGIGPGMKLIGVNGQEYSSTELNAALTASHSNNQPIVLLVENMHHFHTFSIDYHDGLRYPHLERLTDKPDLLQSVIAPKATPAGSGGTL